MKPDPNRLIKQGFDIEDVDDLLDEQVNEERNRAKRKRPPKKERDDRKDRD